MITIFRKEMKKWHSVLWVVFASMAVSGLSLVFWKSHGDDAPVAKIDGHEVSVKDFRRAAQQLHQQFSMLSAMYGVSLEVLLKTFTGGKDLHAMAMDNAIKAALTKGVERKLGILIGNDFFKSELVKNLPQGIADAQGRVNMELYQNYLQRISMTPAEFELQREDDFKKDAVDMVVGAAEYQPEFIDHYTQEQSAAEKNFLIVKFSAEQFKQSEKDLSDEEVSRYYQEHKELYKEPEKKLARFVTFSQKEYEKTVTVSEDAIRMFYEKNKTNRYRVSPKIKIRRISLKGLDAATKQQAESLLKKVKDNPVVVSELAKKFSQDETAAKGGLTDFFSRGTLDAALEKEAFKLMKNGEVAPLIKTATGYEIIVLEDRQAATEKTLDSVRAEITDVLRAKKASNSLKSELEGVIRAAKNDASVLSSFIQKHGKVFKDAGLLSASDGEDGFSGQLLAHLFPTKGSAKSLGYFSDEKRNEFVLYQVVATEKAFLKSLSEVKKAVIADFLKQKSADDLKHFVKKAKGLIMEGKRDLASYKAEGFPSYESGFIKKTDKISAFKDIVGLVNKAFILDNTQHVAEFRSKGDIFLIQLVNINLDEASKKALTRKVFSPHGRRGAMHSFIASLQRNAKIVVDESLASANKNL